MNFSENEVHSLILRSENEHFARRCRHYKSKDSKAEDLPKLEKQKASFNSKEAEVRPVAEELNN